MASAESFVMKCLSLPFSECNERMLLNAIKKKRVKKNSPLSTFYFQLLKVVADDIRLVTAPI